MGVRLVLTVLLFVTLGNPAWCRCTDGFFPPHPIQEQNNRIFAVRELHLINVIHASVEEQEKIAASLAGVRFCVSGKASSGAPEEGVYRLRAQDEQDELSAHISIAFQHLGFFKVAVLSVSIEAPDTGDDPPTVSVTARVDEGARYRLKKITFTGNKAITNTARLRDSFPLKDGAIFDTEKVRKGLENLRKLYGEGGYINFTPVPDTKIDDENKLIALNIDLDEGAAFIIRSFAIEGADAQQKAALTALWSEMLPPGTIYNPPRVALFFQRARGDNLLPPDTGVEQVLRRHLDEHNHSVDIVIMLGPQ